jgi:hypothetical protein
MFSPGSVIVPSVAGTAQNRPADEWPREHLRDLRRDMRRDPIRLGNVGPAKDDPKATAFDGFVLLRNVLWAVWGECRTREADGVAVLRDLRLSALDPRDAALTTRVLAAVPIRELVIRAAEEARGELALDAYATAAQLPGRRYSDEEAEALRRQLAAPAVPPRGRDGTPADFYNALASEAVEIAERGLPIVATLADRRGRKEQTVKTWIRKARKLGALDRRAAVWKLGPKHPAGREQTK